MDLNLIAEQGVIEQDVLHSGPEGGRYTRPDTIRPSDRYIVAELTNLEENAAMVYLAFWTKGEEPEFMIKCGLFPQVKTQIALPLEYLNGNQLFLPPEGIRLKSWVVGVRVNRDEVTKIGLVVEPYRKDTRIQVHSLYIAESYQFEAQQPQKIVDELGQWKQRDWAGKTKSIEELGDYLKGELKKAETFTGFDYSEPMEFEGTGFFRIEKANGRFCLVTPEGKPFFSSGVDCVRCDETGRYGGLEEYFDYLPIDDPEVTSQVQAHNFKEKTPCVAFSASNFKRVFGEEWKDVWNRYMGYKLQDWGFNTIAAWSDDAFIRTSGLPYTAFLGGFPGTEKTVYRDFPDVFSREYEDNAAQYAKQLESRKDDPNMIGYFMSNEPNFAFIKKLNIARELLRNPEPLESKKRLVAYYNDKYQGDIGGLNAAWGTEFASFDDLYAVTYQTQLSPRAEEELQEFSRELVRRYIQVPAQALRKVDPNHLNLGIRFAWIDTDALYAGSEFVDVFSINCYQQSCCDHVDEIVRHTGKPVMIGEYHYGALDSGLPATGIQGCATQKERGDALRYYLEQAAAHPYCVGVHYFQLYDQCILGRSDGENYQIGLLDVCSREYKEVADAYRTAHSNLYAVMFGQQKPFEGKPEPMRPICY